MGLTFYGVFAGVLVLILGVGWMLPDASSPFLSILFSGFIYMTILLGYALLHAPEMVYFYGLRSSRGKARTSKTTTLNLS